MTLYEGVFNRVPIELGKKRLDDQEWWFEFDRYSIHARPAGRDAVYAFVGPFDAVLYIGRADDLLDRLRSHERMSEALMNGAVQLWVHRTGPASQVHFHDVEQRLISAICPPMNKQHNTLASLGGLFGVSTPPASMSGGLLSLGLLGRTNQ